jgi:putative transposase
MARLARLAVAGQVHHLGQIARAGRHVFISAQDYQEFLHLLDMALREKRVALHAYVLLPRSWQLVLTPPQPQDAAAVVQQVTRAYVQRFNLRHGLSGAMFEERYKSSLLEASGWLLPAMLSLDEAPVRVGLAIDAKNYAWSSCQHFCGLRTDRFITPHPACFELGNTPFAREQAYAQRLGEGLGSSALQAIERNLQRGYALGSEAYIAEMEKLVGRRLRPGVRGRPRKAK